MSAQGILFGAFYGIAADRYGRRPILAIALVGIIMSAAWTQLVCEWNPDSCQVRVPKTNFVVKIKVFWSDIFPVKLTWVSSVFQLVGGGSLVVNAMVLVMVADITPDEKRCVSFLQVYWFVA